jgi:hypothetical protein
MFVTALVGLVFALPVDPEELDPELLLPELPELEFPLPELPLLLFVFAPSPYVMH